MFFFHRTRDESFADSKRNDLRVTRYLSRAINYTREANLSESIIIAAARQNYVLTSGKPRCLRRSTP